MRGTWAKAGASLAMAALLALGACGKPTSSTASAPAPESAPTPAPAGPAALSDAQKKALLAELPASYTNADVSNGEAKFAVCRSCHSINQGGEDMVGPNLWGVFGRKAGGKPGYSYSDDMKAAGWTWDADQLDKWIANPHALLANSKMTYVGMPDPADRRDVIAFLKLATSSPPKS